MGESLQGNGHDDRDEDGRREERNRGRNGPGGRDLQILPKSCGTITSLTVSICIPPILARIFDQNYYF